MSRDTVENGLWGFKGDLKTSLEAVTVPVWLESPTSASVLDFVDEKRKEAREESETVSYELVVNYDEAPDNIQDKLDEYTEENGEPDNWGITVTVTNRGTIRQDDFSLFAHNE